MTLEFRPPPYQPSRPSAAEYAQQWGQGLNNIGETVYGMAAQEKQRKMQALTAALSAKEQGIDPNAIYRMVSGQNPPMMPQTQTPPMSQPPSMPTINPSSSLDLRQNPLYASAGTSDYQDQQRSPVVDAWNNHPNVSQFAPQQSGQGQSASPARSIFDSAPVDYNQVIGDLKNNKYDSFQNLSEKNKGYLKELPAYKALSKDETGTNYSAQDVMDAEKGNWNAIAARNGGKIPSSLATLGESATSKEETAYQKKIADAQNGMINVRGDQSIARTENQRDAASMAYNTIERVKKEGRMPSKFEYYDLLGQMWKARTGASPTDQALRDLDQKTFQGDLGKAYTWFSGQPAAATTSGILQNLQDFMAESGIQAEKQHEAYMSPRQARVLNGLKPEDQQKLLNVHRGLSFQDQTGYKPKAIYATNGKQRIMSTDGGQTWVPAQ